MTRNSAGIGRGEVLAAMVELEGGEERLIEVMLEARHRDCPAMWPDAYTEGVARIERMKASWMLAGLLTALRARQPQQQKD